MFDAVSCTTDVHLDRQLLVFPLWWRALVHIPKCFVWDIPGFSDAHWTVCPSSKAHHSRIDIIRLHRPAQGSSTPIAPDTSNRQAWQNYACLRVLTTTTWLLGSAHGAVRSGSGSVGMRLPMSTGRSRALEQRLVMQALLLWHSFGSVCAQARLVRYSSACINTTPCTIWVLVFSRQDTLNDNQHDQVNQFVRLEVNRPVEIPNYMRQVCLRSTLSISHVVFPSKLRQMQYGLLHGLSITDITDSSLCIPQHWRISFKSKHIPRGNYELPVCVSGVIPNEKNSCVRNLQCASWMMASMGYTCLPPNHQKTYIDFMENRIWLPTKSASSKDWSAVRLLCECVTRWMHDKIGCTQEGWMYCITVWAEW